MLFELHINLVFICVDHIAERMSENNLYNFVKCIWRQHIIMIQKCDKFS